MTFSWSSKRKQPGQNATLTLKSGSGSICGYSVVDRSVTFIRPDLQLSESKVLSPLSNFHIDQFSWPYQVTPDWKYCSGLNNFSFNFGINIAKILADFLFVEKNHEEGKGLLDGETIGPFKRSIAPWMYDRSTSQVKDAMDAFEVSKTN